ncbi:MAG: hypothetical protein AAFY34_14585 [Pseudomonadota bacterium]
MILTITRADRLFLIGLRAAATPPGPCRCTFRLFGEQFQSNGARLLGSILALEYFLRLMPTRKFQLLPIESEQITADEAVLLGCLSRTQIDDDEGRLRDFSCHFGTTAPQMLCDLLNDIAEIFDAHDLGFSLPEPVPEWSNASSSPKHLH